MSPATVPDRLVVAPDERRAALVEIIRQARRALSVSLFRANDEAIFAELRAAVDRGVAVEVLTTSRAKGGRRKLEKLWAALERTGASVRSYNDPVVKYHAKYLVADDGPAVVTSVNLTRKCFRRTIDAIVVTHDPAVISGLRRLMASDSTASAMPDDLTPRLIVGPERARRQFTALIEGARSSIRLIDAKLSDPDLRGLLKTRRAAGLRVEIFDAKRLGGLKSHGKIMLVDNAKVVVGSMALAAISLDFRREVAIVVDEPSAVGEAVELFRSVAASAAGAGAAQPDAMKGASW